MFPSPASDGPAPPDVRGAQPPSPMPPSILAAQGQQAQQQQQSQTDQLSQQALNLAMQKLLEMKNTIEGLVTSLKAVDPEALPLLMPVLEGAKAIEGRLSQVSQRAKADQPNLAGIPPGGGQGAAPMGASAMGM